MTKPKTKTTRRRKAPRIPIFDYHAAPRTTRSMFTAEAEVVCPVCSEKLPPSPIPTQVPVVVPTPSDQPLSSRWVYAQPAV